MSGSSIISTLVVNESTHVCTLCANSAFPFVRDFFAIYAMYAYTHGRTCVSVYSTSVSAPVSINKSCPLSAFQLQLNGK